MLKLAASQLSVHAVGNRSSLLQRLLRHAVRLLRHAESEESGLQTPPTKIGNRSSLLQRLLWHAEFRRIGVTNPSYKDRESEFPPTKIVTARGVPKNRGYKPLLQRSGIGVLKNRGYKPLLQRSGIGVLKNRGYKPLLHSILHFFCEFRTYFDEFCVFFAKNCNFL